MMQGECIGYLLGGAAFTGAALLVLREPRLRRRTIDEVAPFLYDPDRDTLAQSLDPWQDGLWMRQADRRLQRVRMEAFRKCLSVELDNVRVIYELALTERFDNQHHNLDYPPELLRKIDRAIDTGRQFLSLARIIRFRLYLAAQTRFHVVPGMPVPRLTVFDTVRGVKLVEAYRAVGEAGEALVSVHGGSQPVTDKIRLCFWMA